MGKYVEFCVSPLNEGIHETVENRKWSSVWALQAAAAVLARPIESIYPHVNLHDQTHTLLSRTIRPLSQTKRGTLPIQIVWTSLGNPCLDFAMWTPSHLIPLTEKWNTALHVNPIKTDATIDMSSDVMDTIVATLNADTNAADSLVPCDNGWYLVTADSTDADNLVDAHNHVATDNLDAGNVWYNVVPDNMDTNNIVVDKNLVVVNNLVISNVNAHNLVVANNLVADSMAIDNFVVDDISVNAADNMDSSMCAANNTDASTDAVDHMIAFVDAADNMDASYRGANNTDAFTNAVDNIDAFFDATDNMSAFMNAANNMANTADYTDATIVAADHLRTAINIIRLRTTPQIQITTQSCVRSAPVATARCLCRRLHVHETRKKAS